MWLSVPERQALSILTAKSVFLNGHVGLGCNALKGFLRLSSHLSKELHQKSLMDLYHGECTGHISPWVHISSPVRNVALLTFSYFNCLVTFVREETVMCIASHSHADPCSASQTMLNMLLKCPYVLWVPVASVSACILHRGF